MADSDLLASESSGGGGLSCTIEADEVDEQRRTVDLDDSGYV